MRERCGAIERRKTSLPPPGLEWVISVTTGVRLFPTHDTAVVRVARVKMRICARDLVTSAEYMTRRYFVPPAATS
jgi:hypothetical protein